MADIAQLDAEFKKALEQCDVRVPLQIYTSNSWRRIGTRGRYRPVVVPVIQRDGHPDISGIAVLDAMVAAFNAMLERATAAADSANLDDRGVMYPIDVEPT